MLVCPTRRSHIPAQAVLRYNTSNARSSPSNPAATATASTSKQAASSCCSMPGSAASRSRSGFALHDRDADWYRCGPDFPRPCGSRQQDGHLASQVSICRSTSPPRPSMPQIDTTWEKSKTCGTFSRRESLRFGEGRRGNHSPRPHDGVDGVVFVVDDGKHRLGILTDLGHVFSDLAGIIGSLDAVLLESNYDPEMLDQRLLSRVLEKTHRRSRWTHFQLRSRRTASNRRFETNEMGLPWPISRTTTTHRPWR